MQTANIGVSSSADHEERPAVILDRAGGVDTSGFGDDAVIVERPT